MEDLKEEECLDSVQNVVEDPKDLLKWLRYTTGSGRVLLLSEQVKNVFRFLSMIVNGLTLSNFLYSLCIYMLRSRPGLCG